MKEYNLAILKEEALNKVEALEDSIVIYPSKDKIFRALDECPLDKVKVVILGQDPYHDGSATGLAFDNNIQIKMLDREEGDFESPPFKVLLSPSLRNIYAEINNFRNSEKDQSAYYEKLYALKGYSNGTQFNYLPEQGVLLLNTALTVEKGKPNSHKEIWADYTKSIIKYISDNQDYVVFILWGANALAYMAFIDLKKHGIVGSSHPSPLSNTKPCGKFPPFTGSNPFSACNKLLTKKKIEPIIW